ncbi:MAG: hypothetical protein WA962_13275 [Ornithinimicrobium sp.]
MSSLNGPLVLRGCISPIVSSALIGLLGLSAIAGMIDYSTHAEVVKIFLVVVIAVFVAFYAWRSFLIRVVCEDAQIVVISHFRRRVIDPLTVRSVDVEAYEGLLSRGPTELFWMLVIYLEGEKNGLFEKSRVSLPILASRKRTTDKMQKLLRAYVENEKLKRSTT